MPGTYYMVPGLRLESGGRGHPATVPAILHQSYSLDVEVVAYMTTSDYDEFLARPQELTLKIVEDALRAVCILYPVFCMISHLRGTLLWEVAA